MDEKLKPCPFCGGEAVLISNEEEQLYSVECKSCDCGTCDHLGAEIAVDVWNRRADEEKIDNLRKELEIMRKELYTYQDMAREATIRRAYE